MYKDSLGNTYRSLPRPKPTPGAKPSKGGKGKIGRSKRAGSWIGKVKSREANHRDHNHKFQSYGC